MKITTILLAGMLLTTAVQAQVRIGMKPEEVENILGKPSRIDTKEWSTDEGIKQGTGWFYNVKTQYRTDIDSICTFNGKEVSESVWMHYISGYDTILYIEDGKVQWNYGDAAKIRYKQVRFWAEFYTENGYKDPFQGTNNAAKTRLACWTLAHSSELQFSKRKTRVKYTSATVIVFEPTTSRVCYIGRWTY
jgi:hypothetical protein